MGPQGLQHARLPCPSLSPRVCSHLCPLSWWCYLTISFSAASFSFLCSFFPSTGSFSMNRLFTSGGQSIEASASVSVLPMNIKDQFPLGLTSVITYSRYCTILSMLWVKFTFILTMSVLFRPLFRLPRWLSSKRIHLQGRRHRRYRFDPWVRKIPWRRQWQPTPAFLLGKSHGQRSLADYSSKGHKGWDTTERLSTAHIWITLLC